jgi:hypothetical protein
VKDDFARKTFWILPSRGHVGERAAYPLLLIGRSLICSRNPNIENGAFHRSPVLMPLHSNMGTPFLRRHTLSHPKWEFWASLKATTEHCCSLPPPQRMNNCIQQFQI